MIKQIDHALPNQRHNRSLNGEVTGCRVGFRAEADTSRDVSFPNAASDHANATLALYYGDEALKASVITRLQRERGNGYVQRVLAQEIGRARDETATPITGELAQRMSTVGSARPLDSEIRAEMETALGQDLSHVRLHTDDTAAGLVHASQAEAFTVGDHVFLGPGKYEPSTARGKQMLVHELAHSTHPRRERAISVWVVNLNDLIFAIPVEVNYPEPPLVRLK